MTMYNMIRGIHPIAPYLFAALCFSEEEVKTIPRLRDIILFQDEIRILTRTGGPNRSYYEEGNRLLKDRSGFLRDWDDPFDSTYAWWAFPWPESKDVQNVLQDGLDILKKERPDLLHDNMKQITDHALQQHIDRA